MEDQPENENLLSAPVKLSPGWEDRTDKSAEELNFKPAHEERTPVDRWRVVYFILLLHGIATLMPWNMFITANSYFVDYKLAGNETDVVKYRNYFLSFLGFAAQIPNLVLNGLNVFLQCKGGNTGMRIVWSIIIVVIMFIITVFLAMIDSSGWPAAFFWITMISVVFINMANGVYQNSVYGIAANLPMKYTNAVVLGSNLSGTITSIIMILSIAMTPDPRTSAIYYFLAAIFILLVAFDTYFILPLMPFYRAHTTQIQSDNKSDLETEDQSPPFLYIFKKCWIQLFGVFFVFFVTLTCFPAIQAGVMRSSSSFFITDKYYAPITCFLFFNAFATLGNFISEYVKVPGPRWVWLPIVLRFLFVPFFCFCNFKPDMRQLPVFINNDYVYITGGILMAVTSGYFSSLSMMYVPRCVDEPKYKGTAGMMGAFFLILGITTGILFSLPVTIFVENATW
ncbi:hypothetical protein NP493_1018g00007 [Ridgeia piscesae]|uniref:Nucleoside transporter n=1 Tax=Ridgeia piscesae TaxID=27915 RepID=A0AAD9KII6_RIDPI|nr:hypothetical protein NP493_1018g00007 [Ridgeia piscesae]